MALVSGWVNNITVCLQTALKNTEKVWLMFYDLHVFADKKSK